MISLHTHRPAIAMIELIFALVVMGIALMSAPMLISTATKTTTVALQQEGINEAVSKVSMIMTYEWDENDVNDSCTPPILVVAGGDAELNEVGTTGRRIGIPSQGDKAKNRRFVSCGNRKNATAPGALGLEGTNKDDIDDFVGTTSLIVNATGAGGVDYIEKTTVSIATAVQYISDSTTYNSVTINYAPGATAGVSTNIKQINVTLTSTSGESELQNKTIILRAFSCNIGGYEYYHN